MPLRIIQRHHAARIRGDHGRDDRRRRAQPLNDEAQMVLGAYAAAHSMIQYQCAREMNGFACGLNARGMVFASTHGSRAVRATRATAHGKMV